jgi:hypothetical protein
MRGLRRTVLASAVAACLLSVLGGAAEAGKAKPKPGPTAIAISFAGDSIPATDADPQSPPSVAGAVTVNGEAGRYTATLTIGRALSEARCAQTQCNQVGGSFTITTGGGTFTLVLDQRRSTVNWTGGAYRTAGYALVFRSTPFSFDGVSYRATLSGRYSRYPAIGVFDPGVGDFVYTTQPDDGAVSGTGVPTGR